MKRNTLTMIAVAGFGISILATAQTQQPKSNIIPANQPPLQLSTPGQPPAPKPITFPPADPKNFTAKSPTVETVNSFLKSLWGYDVNRVWQVEAIQKTEAPGVSRVIVFVGEQGSNRQPGETAFFVTPDGQHIIAGEQIVPFSADPNAANRAVLAQGANGPYRGAKSKKFLLVEFADLQCPHCKEAQPTMDKLQQDFPNAHIVFENFPLPNVHPAAEKAAEYGVCVAQLKGNDAFFQYVQAVFDTQANLTPTATDQTLKDAAKKAGADEVAVANCAETTSTKAAVDASLKLGQDVGVNQTPMLYVNGRPVPVNGVPYATLKQVVAFEETQAGAQAPPPPSLKGGKPTLGKP